MTESANLALNALLNVATVGYVQRRNAVQRAKAAAYLAADELWEATVEAGENRGRALQVRTVAIMAADAVEHDELEAAQLAYVAALDAAADAIE